jgi:hypothetical protein
LKSTSPGKGESSIKFSRRWSPFGTLEEEDEEEDEEVVVEVDVEDVDEDPPDFGAVVVVDFGEVVVLAVRAASAGAPTPRTASSARRVSSTAATAGTTRRGPNLRQPPARSR